jgi:uncharacterized repeat protein (TIGR01451 family)
MSLFARIPLQPRRSSPVTLSVALLIITLFASFITPAFAWPFPDPGLDGTTITSSRSTLTPGEETTITVTLRNSGSATLVDVTVVLPPEMEYIAGSAAGAAYDPANRAISWERVNVPGGGSVPLTLRARQAVNVTVSKEVTIVAAIASENYRFMRWTFVTLNPGSGTPPAPEALAGSTKTASRETVAAGEELTYTITLRNSGSSPVVARVSDQLPLWMDHVRGGEYDAATRTVSWRNVSVPAGGSTVLSFTVVSNLYVLVATPYVNTAVITYGSVTLTRSARVVLVPPAGRPPGPRPPVPAHLAGSIKYPSQVVLGPNDTVTYTIRLHNSGAVSLTVDVVDPIPADLEYVAGSGGNYTPADRTVRWDDVVVPAGSSVPLTYRARPAGAIARPKPVMNEATIVSGDVSLKRRAVVVLMPAMPPRDVRPPTAQLTIEGADVATERNVTLRINATDDIGVRRMLIREWQLVTEPVPHWKVITPGVWEEFRPTREWQLGGTAGTHFIGVWVADEAGNISVLTRSSLDFVSLILPGETVAFGGVDAYLVAYRAGEQVTARLETVNGDADLYVWHPGNLGLPDGASTRDGTAVDTLSFTTPRAGVYLFVVYGAARSTYNLSITPGGGSVAELEMTLAAGKPPTLTAEPVISQAGIDPLGVAESPAIVRVALPLVVR